MGCKADIDAEPIRFHANASSSIDVMRLDRTLGQSRYVACASSCISTRTSLEEGIKLHRFAGIFPEQFSTEAGRHREAVVAADQRMVIRCFRDDLAHFVHDASHVPPPIQRAGPVDAPFWRHHEGRDLVQQRSMRPRRSLHGAAGGKSASRFNVLRPFRRWRITLGMSWPQRHQIGLHFCSYLQARHRSTLASVWARSQGSMMRVIAGRLQAAQ